MLGNVDAGKSTLCGVLTHGELDNGAGKARLNLFRHLHEIQSGHTSSISREILGFDKQGRVSWAVQECFKVLFLFNQYFLYNYLLYFYQHQPLKR